MKQEHLDHGSRALSHELESSAFKVGFSSAGKKKNTKIRLKIASAFKL